MTPVRWLVAFVAAALLASPAEATLGGPDLAEPLGWDPEAREAYFAIHHVGESGYAATIVRLSLTGPDTTRSAALWWSKAAYEDSTYRARLGRLKKKLRPLVEVGGTTTPEYSDIVPIDTFRTELQGPFARYRVRGNFGKTGGIVEAITFKDSGLRMIHLYSASNVLIGVFSFIGIPWESGYEVQIPARLPARGQRIVLRWNRQ